MGLIPLPNFSDRCFFFQCFPLGLKTSSLESILLESFEVELLDFLYHSSFSLLYFTEVVFLQFRDEMRRVNLPSSVSSIDAIKVLFVNAFPGKVSMPDFETNEKSIYIKDLETGVFFQLDDVR